ncbi:hypothetical protein C7974DRAFT_301930 [Boeremia exigua]|uniref:uncharacterized protein n=1 Tax=Boeremia exigua TaxID=749465 RepID=UPI001E8DFF9E|nr:uncharacterized protein C7974DRAFT_301930 [Boeremia exigua]KAH6643188.1 hypothetical protein C7974DRAFT_301930 [Boeremia exigua]
MQNNLHQVEDYVRRTSGRVQYLEALIEQEHSTIGQVTEIKRQLKTAHRNLEKLHFEKCPSLGFEVNHWVQGAMRLAWQAYRRMVKLEEKLRTLPVSLSDSEDWVGDYEKESPAMIGIEMEPEKKPVEADTTAGAAEPPEVRRVQPVTYVPTGAQGARLSAHIPKGITIPTQEKHTETYRMSGVGSSTQRLSVEPSSIRAEQRKEWSVVEELDPVEAIIPRALVEARLREEEAETAPVLIEPDRQRQGSCDGSVVTDMVMNNVLNEDYVLPYLHFIKHHELRALKQWLVENHYVKRSAVISRTEKVLHCLELLQTGCRYETIATMFSRTPRQVESSCHEVKEGLLELHGFTMIKARDQEMYTTLWGLWRKFGNPQDQHLATYYYGFDWLDVGKIMVTLNLYIGRWREQGKFSLEGPSLNWGKFFDAEGTGRFPRMDQPLRLQYSAISSFGNNTSDESEEDEDEDEDKDSDDDSSLYDDGSMKTV